MLSCCHFLFQLLTYKYDQTVRALDLIAQYIQILVVGVYIYTQLQPEFNFLRPSII